jgi:hypothetical protein
MGSFDHGGAAMITEPRVALTERQRALATAIERIAAAAEREQRDLSEQELAHIGAVAAEVATLTRAINLGTDVAASAASGGVHRGHALAVKKMKEASRLFLSDLSMTTPPLRF